jgi:glycosyltransferase involved in cell wall biosynthesis
MRIIQIGSYPLSNDCIRGGVEASVYGLAQELGRGNEVHAFDLPRIGGTNEIALDGVVWVHRFRNNGTRQMAMTSLVKTVVEEIEQLRPDVCHIHGTNLYSYRIFRALKHKGLHAIVTIHGLVRVEKLNALKKQLNAKRLLQYVYQGCAEKRLLQGIPVAIVDTEYVKEMVEKYPIRRKPQMYIIHQGINEDYYSIHCSEEPGYLLSVGAIGERKGHLITLQAYECFRRSGGEAKLIIAGASSDERYLRLLRKAVEDSEFGGQVMLYTDVSYEDLKQLYKKAHLFVLHTQEESQGIVFAEAMATGLPVVSTMVGGVPYVIKHGETGLLSEYGNTVAFARNIQNLFSEESKWCAMSKAALCAARDYHWHFIGNKVMELYQIVCRD